MKKIISTLLLFVSLLTVNGQEPVWKNVHGKVTLLKDEIEIAPKPKYVRLSEEDTIMNITLLSDCELNVEVIIVNSSELGNPEIYREEFNLKQGTNELEIPVKDLKCLPRDSYIMFIVEAGARHYGGLGDVAAEIDKIKTK